MKTEIYVVKAMRSLRVPLFTTVFAGLATVCLGGQAGTDLTINGQFATADLKTFNGRTYVPLADVAKALGMTLVKKPGHIDMTSAGGANEISGTRGKLGETLFTGKWKFTPVSLEQMDSYTNKFAGDNAVQTPRNAGETLFVLTCQLKNAQKEVVEVIFNSNINGLHGSATHTALADDQAHSYLTYAVDAHNETGAFGGPKMLPGSASEFAVIFSVPKGTVPKDVIFTILSGKDALEAKGGDVKGVDLRISVKP